MSSTIQIRVNDELKRRSDALFRNLGTDTTSAVRIFLTQAVACDGFPFEIRRTAPNPCRALSEEEFLQALRTARSHADAGMVRDADEAVTDLRNAYGL